MHPTPAGREASHAGPGGERGGTAGSDPPPEHPPAPGSARPALTAAGSEAGLHKPLFTAAPTTPVEDRNSEQFSSNTHPGDSGGARKESMGAFGSD